MHQEVAKFEAQMALFNTDGGSAHCAQYTVHSVQYAPVHKLLMQKKHNQGYSSQLR